MNCEFTKIALVGRYSDPRVAEPMRSLAGHLTKARLEVLAAHEFAADLGVAAADAGDGLMLK